MGVPDADTPGPVKKRPRLSLKAMRQGGQATPTEPAKKIVTAAAATPATSNNTVHDTQKANDTVTIKTDSDEDTRVPAVASLENLGNTCFLNSVLQVLRYTPGFLEGVDKLFQDIRKSELLRKQDCGSTSDSSEPGESWEVVKNVAKLYRQMGMRECRYEELASDDVMSMALKPDKILRSIRELNPMFEGNLQHDAQELLRCLMCYLQDAEKELVRFYNNLPPRMSPSLHGGPINPIMQRFLKSGNPHLENADGGGDVKMAKDIIDSVKEEKKDEFGGTDFNVPTVDSVKLNLFPKPELLGGIKEEAVAMPATDDAFTPQVADTAAIVDQTLAVPPGGASVTVDMPIKVPIAIDVDAIPEQCIEGKVVSKPARAVARRGRKFVPYNGVPRKQGRPKKVKTEDEVDQGKQVPKTIDKSQPSILSMFGRVGGVSGGKRLGMRGAVIRPASGDKINDSPDKSSEKEEPVSEQSVPMETEELQTAANKHNTGDIHVNDCTSAQTEVQATDEQMPGVVRSPRKSPRKIPQSFRSSPRKPRSSPGGDPCESEEPSENMEMSSSDETQQESEVACPSPAPFKSPKKRVSTELKQPVIKLEKCDRVCSSPMKSVSANFASQQLTPSKSNQVMFSLTSHSQSNLDCMMNNNNYIDESDMSPIKDIMPNCDSSLIPSPLKSLSNGSAVMSPERSSPRKKKDFVENLFQGTMMLRTRCLQCEHCRERREEFHDISVPVRQEKSDSDDEDDGVDSKACLSKLIDASTKVEKLQDENKYFCDKCLSYQEAERSIHYEKLPDILTLHLKRFSASSGSIRFISKINDHVNIPLFLPCLRYTCVKPCPRPDHRFKLYGIVTHAGATPTSGHYLAYVRTFQHPQPKMEKDIRKVIKCPSTGSKLVKETPAGEDSSGHATRRKTGTQMKLPSRFDGTVITDKKVTFLNTNPTEHCGKGTGTSSSTFGIVVPAQKFNSRWLEIDDETVRVFDDSQFEDLLTGDEGSLIGTPYILFYHKISCRK